MKIISLLLLAMSIATLNVFAVTDTLRHYNPNTVNQNNYYPASTYNAQCAYFIPLAPGYIKAITLTLGGSVTNATVKVHIYGHEGGGPTPGLKKDLITPLVFTKTITGIQKVTVTLPSPLWIDNNQFYLEVTNFSSSSLRLLHDGQVYPPNCSSSSGGDYHYIYIYSSTANYYDTKAYAIDVLMDYVNGISSPQFFQDVTVSSGIGSFSTYSICWGDINNDKYLDMLAGGKLFKNNKNGTFTDITASAGINTTPFWITSFIDINNDGKEDIVFLGDATPTYPHVLYLNNGNETFTQSSLNFSTPPVLVNVRSIGVADINNDKYPDLWISEHEGPTLGSSYPHYLFLNDKNNGFTDASTMIYPNGYTYQPTRASMWNDFDDNNQLDLYVGNYRLKRDELWKNNGNGTFTNIASAKQLDINNSGGSGHGTGVDWADYDNDGDMDLLLCQLAHPAYTIQYGHRPTTIYNNSGAGSFNFTDLNPGVNAGNIGIQYEETHAGGAWGDLNSDGLTDIFITSFYGCRYGDVYLQKPNNTFELNTFEFGVSDLVSASDATLADFDNDGRLDMACGTNDATDYAFMKVYKNTNTSNNNWVSIDLNSTSGNYFGIGAKVVVYAGGKKYTQYQIPFHGANMSKGNRLFFGLGQVWSIDSVIVRWPNGTLNTETFTGLAINIYNTLVEGVQVVIGVNEHELSSANVYPNPFSNSVSFDYELSAGVYVSLEIYSMLGQRIFFLKDVHQTAGKHSIQWQGKNAEGKQVSPGIYNYLLQAGNMQKVGKLVMEK